MTARDVARRVLERVARSDAWASLSLDAEFGRSGLDARDRGLATELVYGTLRHQPRLDRALAAHANLARTPGRARLALRLAAYQLLFMRVPAYAAVDDAVDAIRGACGPKVAGFANAVLRKLSASGEPPLPMPLDSRARLEVEHSLPGWVIDLVAEVLPTDQVAAAVAGLMAPARLAVRVNRRKTTVEAVAAALTAEGATVAAVPDHAAALYVDGLGNPETSPSFLNGSWTVQDVGAQLVAELAQPQPGQLILDACAGVGGKSTHLAELADDAATIDAADRSTTKLNLAAGTARRLGLRSLRAIVADLAAPGDALAPAYDTVVLDAPCSGLGVLRRHPEAALRLKVADVARMAEVQRGLLDQLAPRVKVGGTLIYSVCTFTAAEGPAQIDALVARDPRFVVEHRQATWPHRDGADGFFVARLRRVAP